VKESQRLSFTIKTILSANAISLTFAGAQAEQPTAAAGGIEEVIVTAQRRTESAQDVPITVQVLSGETIAHLNVATLEDYVKYLPNVSTAGSGPSQGEIYMRGLAIGFAGQQGAGALYSFPNVAVYLDDQPAQLPYRNLDIYAADLERIEVLEGPQGTLFGAGAQAGVVRYITNKPKLNVTEGTVNAGYAITSGGDPSANVDATLNVPLVRDRLALRLVVYNDSRGGYINNIPGTFSRSPEDKVSINYFGGVVPPNSGPITNNAVVGNAINPVVYKGLRASLLWQINDDWNARILQAYQSVDSDGVFWEEAYDGLGKPLPNYDVQLYNANHNNDKFEDTQLTINGRLGQLQFVYTGGYLDRSSDQVQDYTNYSRGVYAGYYQCNYPGYPFVNGKPTLMPNGQPTPGYCWSPNEYWTDQERSTHQNHEMRLSTPDDWRLRGIVGLFWENFTIHDETDYYGGTSPNFVQIAPPAGASVNNPNVRPRGDEFITDITRGYKQKAAFASVDYELVPKTLIATIGTRYYDIENFEKGANVGSFGCEIYGPYSGVVPTFPCGIPQSNGVNLDAEHEDQIYTGFRSRASLTWHVTRDALLYYTWSEGFRPGGFNRSQAHLGQSSPLYGIFTPPLQYGPDVLVNNELGWKTEWLAHRLLWNGAVYQEDWKEVQISVFDPGVTGNQSFIMNGPNYRVRGVETSFIARITEGLTITASGAWNSSEVVKTTNLVNPATGQPIQIVNPFGVLGSPLANCPPFQGNIRARYEFAVEEYRPFWQLGVQHTGGSYSTTQKTTNTLQGQSIQFYDPAYTTLNAAAGVVKGAWTAQLYGENLTNTHGIVGSFYAEWVKADTIIRPRTLGLRFSYGFNENR